MLEHHTKNIAKFPWHLPSDDAKQLIICFTLANEKGEIKEKESGMSIQTF